MEKILLIFLTTSTIFYSVFAQQKDLTPEQQRLSVFQGKWTIAGSESTYLEICEWIQGNHIQCISTEKEQGKVDSSISYLSYSIPEKTYVYYGLYGSGSSRTLRGNWNNDRFVFEGQRLTVEKAVKWKVTVTPVKNNLHFMEEVSTNEGPWEKKADFEYKRID